MSKPITTPFTFQTQAGPIPLAQLDTNFTTAVNAINDFATYSNYLTDTSGAANTITVTVPVGTTFSYSPGVKLEVQLANTTTSTAVQINVNALGNKAVQNIDGTVPLVGQLIAGMILQLQYNGTVFLLTGSASKPGSIAPFTSNAAGDVTLPAPSSGTALTVNNFAGSPGISVVGAGTVPLSFQELTVPPNGVLNAYVGIGTATFSGGSGINGDLVIAPRSSNLCAIDFCTGNGLQSVRMQITGGGNVTIAAPSSGSALAVTAVATGTAINVNSGPVVVNSNLLPDFVMNASGANFGILQNQTSTSWSFAYGSSLSTLGTPILTWTAAGGVQIGAPTGGDQGAGTLNATGLFVNGVAVPTNSTAMLLAGNQVMTGATGGAQGSGTINSTGLFVNGVQTNPVAVKVKAAATNRISTTTLTNDPDLVFAIAVAGTYKIEVIAGVNTNGSAANGISFTLNYSGTITAGQQINQTVMISSSSVASGGPISAAVTTPTGGTAGGTGANNGVQVEAILVAGGAGTLGFSWAQAVSTAVNTTLNAGSTMIVTRIA